MARSGVDAASLEFREQALSWKEQLEHHEVAGIQVLRRGVTLVSLREGGRLSPRTLQCLVV